MLGGCSGVLGGCSALGRRKRERVIGRGLAAHLSSLILVSTRRSYGGGVKEGGVKEGGVTEGGVTEGGVKEGGVKEGGGGRRREGRRWWQEAVGRMKGFEAARGCERNDLSLAAAHLHRHAERPEPVAAGAGHVRVGLP